VLRLPDHWVWDSWVAHDGVEHHLFFLRASRALLDPERRHRRAAIGHATSRDLRRWELQPDALVHSDPLAWDDLAVWTGSVAQGPDGRWRLFYTGVAHAEDGLVQRIGSAVSHDLVSWTRTRDDPLVEADPRWYEKLDLDIWTDEAWRDPFVVPDPRGDGWHMLITARAAQGSPDGRGVVGHARSADLVEWEVMPPLSRPAGFGQLEVSQVADVDGQPVLVFSCGPGQMDPDRRSRGGVGGVWVAPGESLLGPWSLEDAVALEHSSLYAGRLVQNGAGEWFVIGFRDMEAGSFVGEIIDPLPIARHGHGVRLAGAVGHRQTGFSLDTSASERYQPRSGGTGSNSLD
jgi:beta-fructofuranosidase